LHGLDPYRTLRGPGKILYLRRQREDVALQQSRSGLYDFC